MTIVVIIIIIIITMIILTSYSCWPDKNIGDIISWFPGICIFSEYSNPVRSERFLFFFFVFFFFVFFFVFFPPVAYIQRLLLMC